MTLVLPPWLPPQLVALAAGHFPEAEEDVMRLLAVAKRTAQAGLIELADEQKTVARSTVGAVTGSAGVAAAASITVAGQRLRDLAESLGRLADQLVDAARNMEFEKLLVIYTLIILAIQLTLAAALPGGSLLALARWVTARKTLRMGILQLLARLRINGAEFMASSPLLGAIVQGGSSGVVQGAGADLLAQWTQIGLNTREEVDAGSVWVSAASGGAGGAAGGAAAQRAAPMVGRLTTSMSQGMRPKVEALALGGIGGAVGAPAGLIASVVAAGGDLSDLTAEDWRSGLVSGVGGGVIGAAGYALRRPPDMHVPAMLAPQPGSPPGLIEQRAWAPRTDTGPAAPDRVDLTRAADPASAAPSFSAPATAESLAHPRPQAGDESTHPSHHPAAVPPQPETIVPARRQPLDDAALSREAPGRTATDGPADSRPRPDAAVPSDRSPTNPIVPPARSEQAVQTETTPVQDSPREAGAHQPSRPWTADSLPEQLVGPEAASETPRSGRPSLSSEASEISAAQASASASAETSTASTPAAAGATSSDTTRGGPNASQPLPIQAAAFDSSPSARQNAIAKDDTAKLASRNDGRGRDDARGADTSVRRADTRPKAPEPQVFAPQHHTRRPTAPVLDPAVERSRELWRNVTEAQGVPVVDHTAVFKTEHDDAVHTMRGSGRRFPDADRIDEPAHVDAGAEEGATLRVVASAPHHDLNELLSRYAYADGNGWNGGDSTYIRKLPGGRHVVMFSDTFLGDVNPDGSRSTDTSFISNSFVVIENDGSMRTVLGSTDDNSVRAALPPVDGQFHWLGGSHVTGRDTLDVMFLRFSDGTQIPAGENDLDAARFCAALAPAGDGGWAVDLQENVLARFDAGSLHLLDVTPMPSQTGVHWASWVEFDSIENRTYIYGVEESGLEKFMHVARVQGDDLRQPWEFFDGAGRWSERESDSASIMPGVANEYSVTRLNDGLYLLVTQDASVPFSPDILGYLSKSPTGPFGSPTLLYRTSETGPTGFYGDANMIMYNAHEQPDLRRGNQLTITYNLNSSMQGVLNDSAKYRPTAIKVTIDLSASMRYDSDDLFAPRSADPAGHTRNQDPSAGHEAISGTDRDHSVAQGESFAAPATEGHGPAGMRTPWSPARPADQVDSADAPGRDHAGP